MGKFVSLKGSRAFSSHAHILPQKKEKKNTVSLWTN